MKLSGVLIFISNQEKVFLQLNKEFVKIIHTIKNSQQFQNFIIFGAGQLFSLLTPLLIAPYIIIICGEEGFGKAGIGLSFVFILTVLVDFASGINGVKEISINRNEPKKVQKIAITLFSIKLIALVFVILLSSVLIFLIPFLYKEKALFFFSLIVLVSQAINPTWFLQGIEKFKIISLITISGKLIYILMILSKIKNPSDYIFVNLYFGLSVIITNVFCLCWLVRNNYLVLIIPKLEDIITVFKRDYKLTFSQLLLSFQQYSPILLIGYFGNSILAGQYKIIEQIIMIFRTYLQVLFNFIYPRICFLLTKNKENGIRRWFYFNGLNFILILFSSFFLFIYAQEILEYFNASDSLSLSFYLKLATFIPLLFAINIPLQQLVLAFNFQKKYVNSTVLTSIVLMISIVLFFNIWQLTGVFISLLFAEFFVVLIYVYILRNQLTIRKNEN
ncbi:MAG: oligosaccharide flippase family protein [Flavobacterium sp.]|jgi:O-antigen/teichoic acid export membrane protein|uniref:oligosaccharide flippase family protein n=1 Tax=Flavobacterium sp. TaxID=239 RepID=UPI003BA4F61C